MQTRRIIALLFSCERSWKTAASIAALFVSVLVHLVTAGLCWVMDAVGLQTGDHAHASTFAGNVVDWQLLEQSLSTGVVAFLLIGLARWGVAPENILRLQEEWGIDSDGWVGPQTTGTGEKLQRDVEVARETLTTIQAAAAEGATPKKIAEVAGKALQLLAATITPAE